MVTKDQHLLSSAPAYRGQWQQSFSAMPVPLRYRLASALTLGAALYHKAHPSLCNLEAGIKSFMKPQLISLILFKLL